MTSPEPAEKRIGQLQTINEFFQETIESLLHENLELVISSAPDARRNSEVLHVLESNPRPRVPLEYNYVYHTVDTTTQTSRHGIYLAKHPSIRPHRRAFFDQDSRHYFADQDSVIVRVDTVDTMDLYEFLRGQALSPSQVVDPEVAALIADFRKDLSTIQNGKFVKPLSNQVHRYIDVNPPR